MTRRSSTPAAAVSPLADGEALLRHVQGVHATALASARLEQMTPGAPVRYSIELPGLGQRTVAASSVVPALRALLTELADACLAPLALDTLATLAAAVADGEAGDDTPPTGSNTEAAERFRAKARQATIGATLPERLEQAVAERAHVEQKTFSEVARRLTQDGFDDFDSRSFAEDSGDLLKELSTGLEVWRPSETRQVMLRLNPNHSVRLRCAAKEFSYSASELATMCLAYGLAKACTPHEQV